MRDKLPSEGRDQGHETYFQIFGSLSISLEQMELYRHLIFVCTLVIASCSIDTTEYSQRERVQVTGHV